jgi:hypothetical protein
MIRKIVLLNLFLLISFYSISYAQVKFPHIEHKKGSLQKGDARYEGFRQYENSSLGGILKLKSAKVLFQEIRSDDSKDCKIGFYVHESIAKNSLDILVEGKGEGAYYMVPVTKKWENGFREFVWSNAFAEEHGIKLNDLYVMAEVTGPAPSLNIIPAVLYYSVAPKNVKEYEFTFISTRQVTIIYNLYDKEESKIEKASGVYRRMAQNEEIIIKCNIEGCSEGTYYLEIKGTFTDGKAGQEKKVYTFCHINNLRE